MSYSVSNTIQEDTLLDDQLFDYFIIDASETKSIVVTLPNCVGQGAQLILKRVDIIDAHTVTVIPANTESYIDGRAVVQLHPHQCVTLTGYKNSWWSTAIYDKNIPQNIAPIYAPVVVQSFSFVRPISLPNTDKTSLFTDSVDTHKTNMSEILCDDNNEFHTLTAIIFRPTIVTNSSLATQTDHSIFSKNLYTQAPLALQPSAVSFYFETTSQRTWTLRLYRPINNTIIFEKTHLTNVIMNTSQQQHLPPFPSSDPAMVTNTTTTIIPSMSPALVKITSFNAPFPNQDDGVEVLWIQIKREFNPKSAADRFDLLAFEIVL